MHCQYGCCPCCKAKPPSKAVYPMGLQKPSNATEGANPCSWISSLHGAKCSQAQMSGVEGAAHQPTVAMPAPTSRKSTATAEKTVTKDLWKPCPKLRMHWWVSATIVHGRAVRRDLSHVEPHGRQRTSSVFDLFLIPFQYVIHQKAAVCRSDHLACWGGLQPGSHERSP